MKRITSKLAVLAIAGGITGAAPANAAEDVVIVYDASGSMWGQIDGVSKMEIAREVMEELVGEWDEGTNLGLVAYGHRSQGDCTDIETLIAPGPLDKSSYISTVNAIKPKGKTPISASVQHAADLLSYRDNPATVILISDGLETCNADPCALSGELAKQGVNFTAHVVGFDLEDEAHASLSCIAENTGGVFVPAGNAAELHDALDQVQSAMDLKPVTPEPEPEPEPEEPALPEVKISGPESVTTGAAFDFTWSKSIHDRDFITIVPVGTKEGDAGSYIRVKSNTEGSLTAPAETGLYELRYVLNDGRVTLASAPIEVVEAEVSLDGPESVTTGAAFDFTWSKSIHDRDFITIVPVGTKEGESGSYIRVKSNSEGSLTAPAETGLYELRYVLNEGRATLASAPIEVVEAEVSLDGPESVTTGAAFDFTWSKSIHDRDFITIVPVGTKEGESGSYIRVKSNTEGSLTAPAETGLYELRYVLNEGRATLASAPIEVVEAEVGISGPESVTTGADFDVTWSSSIHDRDFITIVPMGTKEGESGSYIRVKSNSEGSLTAPAETGLYELRYVLNEGRATLASAPIEVVEAEVGISGPESVTTGADFDVTWSSSIHDRDFITIVPMGTKEGESGAYIRVKGNTEGSLNAPAETGLYELRYVLNEGSSTLASAPIEVVEAEVTVTGPETVRAETPVEITWSQTINPNDYITIVPTGAAEGSSGDYIRTRAATSGELTAPADPGLYEIRYILNTGKKTLASATLEVVDEDAPLDDGAGLSVPETATPGEVITVSWSGASDSTDQRIALARSNQPDFSWISVQSVGDKKTVDLKIPDETGYFEVRFLDVSGQQVLGRSIVEVK